MPLYEFRNIDTGERWEEILTFAGREQRLLDPVVEQVPCAPNFVSGIAGVTHKNDSGFGDMMQRIAAANSTSPLADKYGDKSVKASKTRDAVRKARSRM